jgi:hypothetical protein
VTADRRLHGDVQLEDEGTLAGEIRFHLGDEPSFTARRGLLFRSQSND